jgi:ABC-2 type transport system ATP-binding protein
MKSLISIRDLSYTVPYGQTILDGLNLDLEQGQFIGILGHNGSGKTTLLDIIMGMKKSSHGEVLVLNENPHATDRRNKNKIVFLSQDVSINGDLTIEAFCRFHSAFYPEYSKEEEHRLMKVFSLTYDMKIGSLSTGQQKKVQIVANFSAKPELILIDEITAVLDPETREIFFEELLKLKANQLTAVLLATNLAEDLINKADKVLFIEETRGTTCSPSEIHNLFNLKKVA